MTIQIPDQYAAPLLGGIDAARNRTGEALASGMQLKEQGALTRQAAALGELRAQLHLGIVREATRRVIEKDPHASALSRWAEEGIS